MYDELLKFAVQLAKAAGGIQLAYFRGDRLSIETKSNVYDVVTRADRESEKQTLATSVIASGFPYDKDVNPDNNSDNVARIIPYVRDVRRLGSAAYDISCVAAGLLDGYWELALHEWDVCAAELILAEAGGVVCDLRRDRGISIVAGNGAIVKEILKYVR